MNVIQQNALAESLGLSSDQLSDQLLKQEAIGKSRSEIVALGGEEAAKRLESLSAQDKFNSAVEKLQDLLGNYSRRTIRNN
jgi:lipase chaperone LimK